MIVHLVRGQISAGYRDFYWCGVDSTKVSAGSFHYVYEPLFATCEACLVARTRAATALKSPAPAVIVPPYPVNPHG